jgi:hypothetical protein
MIDFLIAVKDFTKESESKESLQFDWMDKFLSRFLRIEKSIDLVISQSDGHFQKVETGKSESNGTSTPNVNSSIELAVS